MEKFFKCFLFLMFLGMHFCEAQNVTSFSELFQELEFDVLPVYSHSRHPDDYLSTSTYPFKGERIDTTHHSFFKYLIDDSEWDESIYYACYKFHLNYNCEAFLIRESKWEGTEHHMHCLVYDVSKNGFTQSKLLSFSYGYEGSFGTMESWIIDVDKDGKKDIVNRSFTESYEGSDAIYTYIDSMHLSLFEKETFRDVIIRDTSLQQKIKTDFPFHEKPTVSYDTENELKELITIRSYEHQWCIIAGSDESIEAAKHEERRSEQIIGYNYKYGLDIRQFNIFYDKDKKRFYSIFKGFKNKNEAEIALKEIQKIFNPTAFVVDIETWCPNTEWNKDGYYHCVDQ